MPYESSAFIVRNTIALTSNYEAFCIGLQYLTIPMGYIVK